MLSGKRIVLGVTGGIAAYKAVELCRLFVKAGADVRVVMTEAAKKFVTPLTFQTASGNRTYDDLFAASEEYSVEHVGLAQNASLIVIAPATANCIAKIAAGIADDLLTTTVLAYDGPVLLAPAMNTKMYENPLTQQNITKLSALGYVFMHPVEGKLACGDTGRGRMAAVDDIFASACRLFQTEKPWKGRRVLVTAGPTRESIDPVRYLSNHSSGKMGFALAQAAAAFGADVTLISGPVTLADPDGIDVIRVTTALEMHEEVVKRFSGADVVIKAAAVADYRPAVTSAQKIKKSGDMNLTMVRNPDILAELGKQKTGQILVGFAAETENLQKNALGKLNGKNLDMIVANDLTQEGAGFAADTNVVKLYYRDGRELALPKMAKTELAIRILQEISEIQNTNQN